MEAIPKTQSFDEISENLHLRDFSIVAASQLSQRDPSVSYTLTGEEVRQVSEEMAGKMNQVASVFNTKLSFSVDNVTGKTVIRVMNSETNEVIRQIPPEHMLQLVSKMRDVMGMVLNIEI